MYALCLQTASFNKNRVFCQKSDGLNKIINDWSKLKFLLIDVTKHKGTHLDFDSTLMQGELCKYREDPYQGLTSILKKW